MKPAPLTPEQQAMIETTLTRIRGALAGAPSQHAPEPAHFFQPLFMFPTEVRDAAEV